MARQNLVVVDDLQLRKMLVDVRFTQSCPCLAQAAKALKDVPKRCGRCARKQAEQRTKIFRSARSCLSKLKEAEAATLKQLLNTKSVRIKKVKTTARGKSVVNVTL